MNQLLRQVTAQDLIDWEAYSLIEPWDEGRADMRAAIVAQMITAVNLEKGKRPPPLRDFTIDYDEIAGKMLVQLNQGRVQSGSSMRDVVKRLHIQLGGDPRQIPKGF